MSKGIWIGAVEAKNKLANGNFETDAECNLSGVTSKCTISRVSEKHKYGSYALKAVVNTTTTDDQQLHIVAFDAVVGHKYYMSGWFEFSGSTSTPYVIFCPGDDWNWITGANAKGTAGVTGWQRISCICDNTSYTKLRARWSYGPNTYDSSNPSVMYLDGCVLVDLTEAFGSGKEPDKAWCDKNLDWFSGNKTFQNDVLKAAGYARQVKNLWVGVDGVARTVKRVWIGDSNNEPRIVYGDAVIAGFLTFKSDDVFTLSVANPGWDGTMEYSTNTVNWNTWDGSGISGKAIYMRGTGNTVVTGNFENKWSFSSEAAGFEVECWGNIETLLDYITVCNGEHPNMSSNCFYGMFETCTVLTRAPKLPATNLTFQCYAYMFYACEALKQAPALPATVLADWCYSGMFASCTSLTRAPKLPATTLADSCYREMFDGCTALAQAPALPATTLADSCYREMFDGCTALAQAPALPATTLGDYCYNAMFFNCKSLMQAPALPATTLADYCYVTMFAGCESLTQAPWLPATKLTTRCYRAMFSGCQSLGAIPILPATTLTERCYENMFSGCPIDLSTTKNSTYTTQYRIPASGTGTEGENSLTDMFDIYSTICTPAINTTYYLHKDIAIVGGYTWKKYNITQVESGWADLEVSHKLLVIDAPNGTSTDYVDEYIVDAENHKFLQSGYEMPSAFVYPVYVYATGFSVGTYEPYLVESETGHCINNWNFLEAGASKIYRCKIQGYASAGEIASFDCLVVDGQIQVNKFINGAGTYIESVTSTDSSAYPSNGIQDGHWYVLQN